MCQLFPGMVRNRTLQLWPIKRHHLRLLCFHRRAEPILETSIAEPFLSHDSSCVPQRSQAICLAKHYTVPFTAHLITYKCPGGCPKHISIAYFSLANIYLASKSIPQRALGALVRHVAQLIFQIDTDGVSEDLHRT